MKKLLLTMLAVVASTAMFAQLQKIGPSEKINVTQMVNKKTVDTPLEVQVYDAQQARAQKRADASSIYYAKPSGSFYYEYDKEGYGNYWNLVFLPAFNEYEFTNMSPNPTSCIWTINNVDYTAEYTDAEGNWWYAVAPSNYVYYCPVLWNSSMTESYKIPSYWADNGYPSYVTSVACIPSLEWMGLGNPYTIYSYGWLDSDYVSGTGTYTNGGYTYTSVGIRQEISKPASPLYFDELTICGVTDSQNEPLRNSAELSMELYDITDPTNPKLYATLTATADDWCSWGQNLYGDYMGVLSFTMKEDNPLFGTIVTPVTIDCPTEICLYGFEDTTNINFGPCGQDIYECDADLSDTKIMLTLDGDEYYFTYGGVVSSIFFHGIMDVALVADTLTWYNPTTYEPLATISGYNTLIISDDGQECYNDVPEDYAFFTDGTGAVYADITCPWFEGYDENYYFTDLPEWITVISVYDDYYDIDSDSYAVYVKLEAEALPNGTTYRAATTYLHGRGYQSDVPIYLLQGDIPEGIESIPAAATTSSASKGTYNLAGQRVSDSAKGILVRDGKKFIAK